jgi:hypothetical protein
MLNKYRQNILADSKLRDNIFDRINRDKVIQTTRLRLNEPTEQELRTELNTIEKIFSIGDRMYKYAYEIYGSVDYWWIIAWFNNKPTDAHIKVGEVIHVPVPLDKAIIIATREK